MQKYAYIFILLFLAGLQKFALPAELITKQNTIESSFIEKTNFNSTQNASNELIVKNDSGKVDQLNRIEIGMKNDSEISAFQFDLVLPEGFSVVADSSTLTDRSDGHSLSIREYAANTFRFVSYSGSLKTYADITGVLVKIALQTEQETSPGIYTFQLQNVVLSDVSGNNVVSGVQNGQFKLLPATIYDSIFASICEGEIYEFGTQTLTSAGEYTETFEASNGADSVVLLNLTVHPVYNESHIVEICESDSYLFGAVTLTTSGEYTETFETVNGCDSTVTLTLTVHPSYNNTTEAVICEGETYQFGEQTLSAGGEYTETFQSVSGCDSMVTLLLTVHPVYNESHVIEICESDSYVFGTVTLTTSGEYTGTFETVNGCDSIVNLTLTVNPVYNHTDEVAICEGEIYAFGSQSLTTYGEYTEVFQSENGCDSTVTLTLTVHPTYNDTAEAVICVGGSYQFGNQTLTSSGYYTETFETVNGCDSIVSLTLTVNPGYNHTYEAAICEGENYQFGTQSLTTSGEYTETFKTEENCDSTVMLTLTVYPTYNHFDEVYICEGDNYQFGTQTFTIGGEYTEIFESVNGCDSTVTLLLTVNPVYEDTVEVSVCEGETYPFGTQFLTTSGEYTGTFRSVNGCDSTVTLTFTVHPTYNHSVEAVICEGETYQFGTQTLTGSGEYTQTFEAVNGCDSIVSLALTVNPVYNHTDEATICEGETYQFGGTQSLTTSGEYIETFETVNGCDSVVNLALKVRPVYETVISDTIVQGDTLIFGTQILTDSGEYQETFQSLHGCDSLVRLTLTKTIKTTAGLNAKPGFSLGQNYPNPFNETTIIPFELKREIDEVQISVVDITGRQVKQWHFSNLNSGKHKVEWTGKEQPGVYLYKMYIKNDGQKLYGQTKRMIVK